MADNRNSARLGKAVEQLVAASCVLISDLELNVSTSLVDDEGIDLVFHRREHVATMAVQVKSRSFKSKTVADRSRLIANVGANTFRPRRDLYMLFVAVDSANGTFGPVWLVPSAEFEELTEVNGNNRRVFSASMKPNTNDMWRCFRSDSAELPKRILEVLADMERAS